VVALNFNEREFIIMDFKVCVQRYGGFEFRTVTVDIDELVKKELTDQCGGIGGIDLEKDGFTIESVKASSIDMNIE
jgi:hypothetical protein